MNQSFDDTAPTRPSTLPTHPASGHRADPLDALLRPPDRRPLIGRLSALGERRGLPAWSVTAAVAALLVLTAVAGGAVWFAVNSPAAAPALSLPRASADASGGSATTAVAAPSSTLALTVHIAGAVNAPGLVTLGVGHRVADAIAAGGGLRADADVDRVNLAAPVGDGVRIYIPVLGQPVPGDAVTPSAAAPSAGSSGATDRRGGGVDPAHPVDLNTADAAAIEALPGIGPAMSRAIVAYRSEHGRFRSVDELQDVRGIGPAKFKALDGLVTAS